MSENARASFDNEIGLMRSFDGCRRIVQLRDAHISTDTGEVGCLPACS
jgi:hypothetical protein